MGLCPCGVARLCGAGGRPCGVFCRGVDGGVEFECRLRVVGGLELSAGVLSCDLG